MASVLETPTTLAPAELAAHAYNLQSRGYTVVPDFLAGGDCERLAARLQEAIEAYQPRPGSVRSELDRYLLHDLVCRDLAFAALLDDPRLQPLVAPLLGEHWIMYAYTSSSLPPGGTNYGHRVHVDSPRFIANYPTNVGLVWALDDFSEESGGTEVLPGSHQVERLPDEAHFNAHHAKLACRRGSLVIFQARLAHRSGVNRTPRWRHALTLNACRPWMKQRLDWVRFVPEAIAGRLGPQGRRLLGYDTRIPASLDELFLPEDRRLYKANQG
jgi:ectoine hydroxylase-related dioxygenase (phytanoyl-CoA dioxygenase family)